MTLSPRELVATVARMPLSLADRRTLRGATPGGVAVAVLLVAAHRCRQTQADRPIRRPAA